MPWINSQWWRILSPGGLYRFYQMHNEQNDIYNADNLGYRRVIWTNRNVYVSEISSCTFGTSAIDATIGNIIALPVKKSVMGIFDPTAACRTHHRNSQVMCSILIPVIRGKSIFCLKNYLTAVHSARNTQRVSRNNENDLTRASLLQLLPPAARGELDIHQIIKRGANTGAFLSTISSQPNGNHLNLQEF